jgi:hypothetical protein
MPSEELLGTAAEQAADTIVASAIEDAEEDGARLCGSGHGGTDLVWQNLC